jgi:1,4-alpha-glucan branching enzyme
MFLIDYLHQRNLGVILDWVGAYFPPDAGGLAYFDGTHLYEHGSWPLVTEDGQKALPFDYSRPEVRSFLLSSAFFWLEQYHADGLRLGDVASMLYLDWGRQPGEWVSNPNGGRENVEGLNFVRQLNTEISRAFPGALTFAEETSAWPMASHSAATGGLGFSAKWDCSFVDDVLEYMEHDPFFRKFHHDRLTCRSQYAVAESFVMPLSHRPVGPGRQSLLARMPGDEWQRFANLRLLLGFLFLQPGKKLLFMGDEFGQWQSWNPAASLDWHLCRYERHNQVQRWVGDLNRIYREETALHREDDSGVGFEWVEAAQAELSVAAWLRRDPQRREVLLAACNFTPVVRRNYRLGVRRPGRWREILNSDGVIYGGSGQGNFGGADTSPFTTREFPHTLVLTLPPLATVVFKYEGSVS